MSFISNDEFTELINKKYTLDTITPATSCPECNGPYCKFRDGLKCQECGFIEHYEEDYVGYNNQTTNTHNARTDSSSQLRIVGSNAYFYNKSILGTGANYEVTRRKVNKERFEKFRYQSDLKLPKKVMNEAAELYDYIQSNDSIRRGRVKDSLRMWCVAITCQKYKITKKRQDLAEMGNMSQTKFSKGEKILEKLKRAGKIDIDLSYDWKLETEDYVDQFMESLKIKQKYKQFIMDLIFECHKHNIGRSSVSTSKAAGAIYVLVKNKKIDITKIDIAEQCSISKTTFIKYADEIKKHIGYVRNVFKKHRIPLQ